MPPLLKRQTGLGQLGLQMLGAQHRSKAGPQFSRLKGLSQVIDRSQFESPQLVRCAVPRGQDDDGNGFSFRRLLELAQQLEPIDARQSEIKQDQIEMLLPRQLQSGERVAGTGEGYVVILQKPGKDLRHPDRKSTRLNSSHL